MALQTWTDVDLIKLVPNTINWADLMRRLELHEHSAVRPKIQRRVAELDLDTSHYVRQFKNKKCSLDDCEKKHQAFGFCVEHYGYWKRNGSPETKIRLNKYRYNAVGYVMLQVSKDDPFVRADGRIMEHRYVMSKHLGRKLLPHEQVHHKNGDKKDNRLENLELWSKNQPIGSRVSDLVEFAYEIIRLYGDDFGKDKF